MEQTPAPPRTDRDEDGPSAFQRLWPLALFVLLVVPALAIYFSGRGDGVPTVVQSPEDGPPFVLPSLDGACQVQLVPRGVMLRSREEGEPDPGNIVARSSGDLHYTSAEYEQGVVVVWDEDGHFLTRLGREGEGPEEFGTVSSLLPDTSGGVHVLHGAGRWSYIDAEMAIRPLGTHPALFHADRRNTSLLSDSLVVVAAMMGPNEPSRGRVLTHSENRIEVVGEFETGGEAEVSWSARMPSLSELGPDGSFWTGPWFTGPDTYRLDQRDVSGRLLQSVERPHEWPIPGPASERETRLAIGTLAPLSSEVAVVTVVIPPPNSGSGTFHYFFELLDMAREDRLAIGSRRDAAWMPRLAFTGIVNEPEPSGLAYSYHRTAEYGVPSIAILDMVVGPREGEEGATCPMDAEA